MKKSILNKVRSEIMTAMDVQVDQDKGKGDVQVAQDKEDVQVAQDKEDVQVAQDKEDVQVAQDKDDIQVNQDKDGVEVDMDVDKVIFKEEEASERHIKIVEMTNELMAASTGPVPRYEIVWRKQDAPGNRRKRFIHPRGKEDRNDERPPSRREREWLEMGNQFEPIVTVFGPGHFLHHSGYGGRQGEMFQLEDGSVIKGIKEDDDIPEKREPTALERSFMEQRKFFEDDDSAFD